MNDTQLSKIVNSFCKLPQETEWVEFKHNNADPEKIGEYISALSNSAALLNQPSGFLLWGIDDNTHSIVGTNFQPSAAKIKGQELENWLNTRLTPAPNFSFHAGQVAGQPTVLLEIAAARHTPVRFRETEYIRVGSYKKKLKDHPEKERALWELFRSYRFERDVAMSDVGPDEVLRRLDYPTYFDLTKQPLPHTADAILNRLADERVIVANLQGSFDITNLGAILFAKSLSTFDRLGRKALRVIVYRGKGRFHAEREHLETKGYAASFTNSLNFIDAVLPANEEIGLALRSEVRMYPPVAIRELVANTLIHQDFTVTGAGPTVEIFTDRIEITNPGAPLIDPLRFIDQPPRSRNEDLAAFMRRMEICEERGSGIDKAISAIELFQLPPPDFRVSGDNTIAILYADKPYSAMTPQERRRACYQHACLRYVCGEKMTNTSLRERMKIEDQNRSTASRIITETAKANLIKLSDPDITAKKLMSYVPFWA